MKADKLKQILYELIAQGNEIYETKYEDCILGCTKEYIRDTKKKEEWDKRCLMRLQRHYPDNSQTKDFEKLCSRGKITNYGAERCRQQIAILTAFAEINPRKTLMEFLKDFLPALLKCIKS
jgi:hypothetical protein